MGKYTKNKSQRIALRQKQAIRMIHSDTVRKTIEKIEKLKILSIIKSIFINLLYPRLKLKTTP